MFRVIILHEPVVGKFFSNGWDEHGLQDVAEQISIHDAIKDTNLCGTVSANSCPNMNLQRMFWFRFLLRWLVYLPVTGVPVMRKGNGALAAENHVVESVATLQDSLCVLQLLDFVVVSYKLAVPGPL